jgi:hypothetical protein
MTGFFSGRAVGRIDKVLINGKEYTESQLKEMISKGELISKKPVSSGWDVIDDSK